MTKIAISPNVSGTGTFTIAAPNSNTDRTFTLPDATGEVYTSGNILGTVSQSGGVPTGAIIERGSNANGEFVKYADGTAICIHVTIVDLAQTSVRINMPIGLIEGETASQYWSLVDVSRAGQISALENMFMGSFSFPDTSNKQWVLHPQGRGSGTSLIRFFAIGRWY